MHPELAGYVQRVRRAFNVSAVAEAAAVAALEDEEHVRRSTEVAQKSISLLSEAATALGMRALSSVANFVLIDTGSEERAKAIYDRLLRAGVIVRPMTAWGLPSWLRLSVGTDGQTNRAVQALRGAVS
jgi:histidinol-phosphate aminotransferase